MMVSRVPETSKKILIENTKSVIARAREQKIQIIYVVVQFRKGHPEIGDSQIRLAAVKANNLLVEGDMLSAIFDELKPVEGDIVVTKRRTGAVYGTDLEIILNALKATQIYITGIATSVVVHHTAIQLAERDKEITIIADCCSDPDQNVHEFLVEHIFPKHYTVQTAQQTLDSWK
jgi:nicotinamidase-related amidase